MLHGFVGRPVFVRALLVVVLLSASGCWLETGFDARRSGFDQDETVITPATVGNMHRVWSVSTGSGPAREPVVIGGTVYVRTSGTVKALDAGTGATRWSVPAPGDGAAAYAGNRLWVPIEGQDCSLRSLNPSTGATLSDELMDLPIFPGSGTSTCDATDVVTNGSLVASTWSFVAQVTNVSQCPVGYFAGTGIVVKDLTTSGHGFQRGGEPFSCTPPTTPPPKASHSLTIWTRGSDGLVEINDFDLAQSRLVSYLITSNCSGCTGQESQPPDRAGWPAEIPTVASDGKLVLTTSDIGVLVWDRVHPGVVWRSTSLAAPGRSLANYLPAAVTSTTVYLADPNGIPHGTLAAFPLAGCGAPTCGPSWTTATPGGITGRPTVAAGIVWIGTTLGAVVAYPADGCGAPGCGSLWGGNVPAAVAESPVVADGTLYVTSTDGTLTAFRPT